MSFAEKYTIDITKPPTLPPIINKPDESKQEPKPEQAQAQVQAQVQAQETKAKRKYKDIVKLGNLTKIKYATDIFQFFDKIYTEIKYLFKLIVDDKFLLELEYKERVMKAYDSIKKTIDYILQNQKRNTICTYQEKCVLGNCCTMIHFSSIDKIKLRYDNVRYIFEYYYNENSNRKHFNQLINDILELELTIYIFYMNISQAQNL